MSVDSLRPADLDVFAALGIPDALLTAAGVRRVSHTEARDVCGIRYKSDHLEGLAFPYRTPHDDTIVTWRIRRDHPEVELDGTPIAKYVSPLDRKHLYFVPGCAAQLADVSVLGILGESEKAALTLTAAARRVNRNVLAIALGGCWGWRGVVGQTTNANGARVPVKGPLPDLDRVTWTNRDVVILFDANVTTNEKVSAARRALAAELTTRGAHVRTVDLPLEPGVNGPDDYRATHGDAALFALIDGATPFTSKPTKKEKTEKTAQGRDVQLEDPEPWAEPVNGVLLLDAIANTFMRYLALPAHASTAMALWVLHVYAFAAWFTSPFLAITSPVKRCGKTVLLIVLGSLAPRRLFASNVTPAVLFRTIEKYTPTLLIDEADTFVRDNDELRGVLNSGHTKTTAVTIRAVGDDHEPRVFSTWCAKAIALIGKLPGTLDDRSIEIRMRRRTAAESVARLRQDRIDAECADLRRHAARWAADHLDALRNADPEVPSSLHDRAADCWRALVAIADVAGGTWPVRAREAAIALSGAPAEDDASTLLLTDIRAIFTAEDEPEVLASSTLVERLLDLDDRPWKEWSKGRPLSAAKVARMLAGYQIFPAGTIRIGAKTAKGYRRDAFVEAWQRYLGDVKPSQRNKPNESGPEVPISNRHIENPCDGLQSVTNPMNTEDCYGVTVSNPPDDAGHDVEHPGRRDAFVEAWQRYLGDVKPSNRRNPNETGPELAISNRRDETTVDALKMQKTSIEPGLLDGSTVQHPEPLHVDDEDESVEHPDFLWRDQEEHEAEARQAEREAANRAAGERASSMTQGASRLRTRPMPNRRAATCVSPRFWALRNHERP